MTITSAGTRTAAIAFVAFVGLGLTSGLLGLAWPSMQQQFSLPLDAVNVLYLVQTATYTLAGFYIGRIMGRLGSGTALLLGAALMTVCMFGIALAPAWGVIVVLGLFSGLGSGIVDAGMNFYVAAYHSARTMNWLHASFGLGVTLGPLIMTYVLSRALGWQVGYTVVGAALIAVVLLLGFTRRLWRNEGFQTAEHQPARRAAFGETLRIPALWFSMITFLAYVGTEIGIGQWAYILLTESRGMPPEVAGPWVSVYWGTFTGGRILFGIIANRYPVDRVLRLCMFGMIISAALFWWNPVNAVGLLGLVVIGFVQAPIFPMMMTDTARRIGAEHAENTISMQMGAVGIGAALLPGLIGTVGKNFGLEMMTAVFLIMAALVFVSHEVTRARRVERPAIGSVGD